MRRIRQESRLLFWFACGVIPVTLLMNRLLGSGVVHVPVLGSYLQDGWQRAAAGGKGMVWRIVLTRLAETAFVAGICRSRMRGLAVRMLPWLWGAATAVLLVVMTWYRGIWGLVYGLLPLLPHGPVYAVLWFLLLWRCSFSREVRRGRFWSALIFLLAAGILLEIYVNPWFVRLL